MSLDNFIFQKLTEGLGFEPTPCQENLFRVLSAFIKENENDILLINGYAGTGKTSSISSLVSLLKGFGRKFILTAPTGRAAKVLAAYTGQSSYTVHKQIYRQKSIKDGLGQFTLDVNKNRDTVFIVDEASLISSGAAELSVFGSGNLLDDLITYVRSNTGNKLILIGDSAQLPPVGEAISRALDFDLLNSYGNALYVTLSSVVRQAGDSGILVNATLLREMIESDKPGFPKFILEPFSDVERISGADLIEHISQSYEKNGVDETLILCRSNKRANRYNAGIRGKILFRDERLSKGDKLMIVKNCYQFLDDVEDVDFIANGDVAELMKISNHEERYGLNFAKARLRFPDYNEAEIEARIILDTLDSETASLGSEQQKLLFNSVMEDYSHIKIKRKRVLAVREDKYFNALQIKYANAITCHKSQGGQWNTVFIDNPFWRGEITIEDMKWLYTAITRAVSKVYFVNFDDKFFA